MDEYQDVGPDQYDLISSLGRQNPRRTGLNGLSALRRGLTTVTRTKLQTFNGSSTEFIRRFESDYRARPAYLTANYRSTANIISAANIRGLSRPGSA